MGKRAVGGCVVGLLSSKKSDGARNMIVSILLRTNLHLTAAYPDGHARFNCPNSPISTIVYGPQKTLEKLCRDKASMICQLNLVLRKKRDGKKRIEIHLRLVRPSTRITHLVSVVRNHPGKHFTTPTMSGYGVLVQTLGR